MAIGTDMIDLAACISHNIRVVNVPAASNESVAEHAIALYFSLRRMKVRMHGLTVQGEEWVQKGSLRDRWGECPGTCREEVVGIIGGGELGNRVATICKVLGLQVHFIERKSKPADSARPGYIPFTTALNTSTVLFLTLPLTPSTLNLIFTSELSTMLTDSLIINVARGGIINESALIEALKSRKVFAAATDVYATETAGKENCVLIQAARAWENDADTRGRLVLSPHLAWWGRSSIEKLRSTVQSNIESWAVGKVENEVL